MLRCLSSPRRQKMQKKRIREKAEKMLDKSMHLEYYGSTVSEG